MKHIFVQFVDIFPSLGWFLEISLVHPFLIVGMSTLIQLLVHITDLCQLAKHLTIIKN